MVEDDPVLGRLDDALQRVNKLEERAVLGEEIPNHVIVTEMRAIRDDMVAERKDTLNRRVEFINLMATFLPRQPATTVMKWVVTFITTVAGGLTIWWITKG
jgi:hypothetical protein